MTKRGADTYHEPGDHCGTSAPDLHLRPCGSTSSCLSGSYDDQIFFFQGGMDVLNDFGLSVLTHPGSVAYSGVVSLDQDLLHVVKSSLSLNR